MNITKKILSVILCVFLAVSVFGICASAEEETTAESEALAITVTTDASTYQAGDEVTVTVSIKNNYNMTAFRFPVLFNSDVFEVPNLVSVTALNTCKAKGTLTNNAADSEKFMPESYDASEFGGILFQWTASVSNSTLGCLNLPEGEACFSFTLTVKSSATGKEGTILVPSAEEYTGYYYQAIKTPTDATTIYYIDSSTFTTDNISATVAVVGETVDLVPNEAYDSTAVIDKENMYIYGLDEGMVTTAELKQKIKVSGSGASMKIDFTDYGMGTGTKVNLVVGGQTVKTYTIVLFGDVNGDALIDGFDIQDIASSANLLLVFSDSSKSFAADVNGDGSIDGFDIGKVSNVVSMLDVLDQAKPY